MRSSLLIGGLARRDISLSAPIEPKDPADSDWEEEKEDSSTDEGGSDEGDVDEPGDDDGDIDEPDGDEDDIDEPVVKRIILMRTTVTSITCRSREQCDKFRCIYVHA